MRCRNCDFWPTRACVAQFEQLAFAVDRARDFGIAPAAQQFVGKRDRVGAVALGFEPRLARRHVVETLGDDGEIGARDRLVEPHHDVARLDAVAVAHAHLADHAAGRVLHFLDVGVDHDRAGCDQRAGQSRVVAAQPPTPPTRTTMTTLPARRCWRMDDLVWVVGSFVMTGSSGIRHDLERTRQRGPRQHLGQHFVLRTERLLRGPDS